MAWHAPMFAVLNHYQSLGVAPCLGSSGADLRRGGAHLGLQHLPAQHLAAAVWHGCYNLAAATQANQETAAAVVTTAIMVWAILLALLEVRANRRGSSVLRAQDNAAGWRI